MLVRFLSCACALLLAGCSTRLPPAPQTIAIGRRPTPSELERLVRADLQRDFAQFSPPRIESIQAGQVTDWREGVVPGWVVTFTFPAVSRNPRDAHPRLIYTYRAVIREGRCILLQRDIEQPYIIV